MTTETPSEPTPAPDNMSLLKLSTFGAYDWWHFGFLWVQKSRALHYGAYFFLGAGAGAYGLRRGLVAKDGKRMRFLLAFAPFFRSMCGSMRAD